MLEDLVEVGVGDDSLVAGDESWEVGGDDAPGKAWRSGITDCDSGARKWRKKIQRLGKFVPDLTICTYKHTYLTICT